MTISPDATVQVGDRSATPNSQTFREPSTFESVLVILVALPLVLGYRLAVEVLKAFYHERE
jgi:hypothetical protein